jgi:hypothetical protein
MVSEAHLLSDAWMLQRLNPGTASGEICGHGWASVSAVVHGRMLAGVGEMKPHPGPFFAPRSGRPRESAPGILAIPGPGF